MLRKLIQQVIDMKYEKYWEKYSKKDKDDKYRKFQLQSEKERKEDHVNGPCGKRQSDYNGDE